MDALGFVHDRGFEDTISFVPVLVFEPACVLSCGEGELLVMVVVVSLIRG